jgi:ABC-type branched-subunit amino acid transport system substrate-binding protein
VRRHLRAILLLAVGLVGGPGCHRTRETAVIAIEAVPGSGTVEFISAVLDSTARAGDYPVQLLQPGDLPVPSGEPYLIEATYRALQMQRRHDVVAVVGPAGSTDALLVGSIYRSAGLLQLVPTGNAPQLAQVEDNAFLMAPRLDEEVRFMADYVSDRIEAHSAVILYTPGAWGSALQAELASSLWQRGVRVLQRLPIPLVSCAAEDGAVRRLVPTALQTGRPDVIVLATYDFCLIKELELQAPGMTYVAGDGLVLRPGETGLGAAGTRTHAVAFWNPAENADEVSAFRRAFEHATGRPPTWSDAATYDAVMVLAAAIRAVGPDRAAVARYLRELGRERPPYRGVTGPIDFRGRRTGRLIMETATDAPLGDSAGRGSR